MERLIETLKEPVRLNASFDARVMNAIETGDARRDPDVIELLPWLRRRTIRLSPIAAGAFAAGIAALALAAGMLLQGDTAQNLTADADAGAAVMTQFVLVAPTATSVAVVGDFNDWNLSATPLARAMGDGVWWVTLPLSPGRYRYAFVVDGSRWRGDPDAPAAEDEFGRPSSVVSIGGV